MSTLAAVAGPLAVVEGGQLAGIGLVLARATGFVVTAPFLGHRRIPGVLKAGLAAAIAVALAPRAGVAAAPMPLAFAFPLELAIGLALGAILALGLAAFEMVGRLVSLQLGFSLGAVFGPGDGEAGTVLDPLFAVLAGLLFFALDLHLGMVAVLARSLETLPLAGGWPADLPMLVVGTTTLALDLAVRIAMPMALALLLVELAVALVARAIPQVNVFFLGLPLKILAGLAILAAALPGLVAGAQRILTGVFAATGTGVAP